MTSSTLYGERLSAVQSELRRCSASLLVVGLSSSMRYLTGFTDEPGERLLVLLIPREGEPAFVVPELYAEQVLTTTGFARHFVWADHEGSHHALAAALKDVSRLPGPVLVEESLWSEFLLACQRALPHHAFASATPVLAKLRMRKDAQEVELLRRAGAIADEAFRRII